MGEKKQSMAHFNIYGPKDLKEDIDELSDEEGRSFSAQCIYMLKLAYRNYEALRRLDRENKD